MATIRRKSSQTREQFSSAILDTIASRRQRNSTSTVDQWHVINMPIGFVARRRRNSQLRFLLAKEDLKREDEKRPPRFPPLIRFKRAARVILHLCRFCLFIAKKCRDMTPSTVDEMMYFAGKGAEESNRLGFNKDRYRRNYGESLPPWAKDVLMKQPLDRLPHEIKRLRALLRTIEGYKNLSSALQEEASRVVQYERYGPNRVVLKEGHIGNAFYIVYSGSLFVNRYEYDKETRTRDLATVDIILKGNWFGEIALLRNCTRTASVVTREPVELLSIDKRSFVKHPSGFESEMIVKQEFSREVQFFNGWKTEDLDEMLFKSQVIEFEIGKVIDKDGSKSPYLYIMMEGRCKVLRKVNIQKLRAKVEAERAAAAVNSWIKTHIVPPVCPKPVVTKHQVAQQRKGQSYFEGHQKRKSLAFNTTHEENEKQVFIHVGNITAKTVFDLSWMDSTDPPPTFVLVSEGSKALRMSKSTFLKLSTDQTLESARNCIVRFCTDGELYDECKTYKKWRTYRQTVVSDQILSQLERGVWRAQKAAEATVDSMFQTATKPLELPRYFNRTRGKRSQIKRKPSELSFESTALISQLTMSTLSARY